MGSKKPRKSRYTAPKPKVNGDESDEMFGVCQHHFTDMTLDEFATASMGTAKLMKAAISSERGPHDGDHIIVWDSGDHLYIGNFGAPDGDQMEIPQVIAGTLAEGFGRVGRFRYIALITETYMSQMKSPDEAIKRGELARRFNNFDEGVSEALTVIAFDTKAKMVCISTPYGYDDSGKAVFDEGKAYSENQGTSGAIPDVIVSFCEFAGSFG